MARPANIPHGFVLSDAALYSFQCQDVFPDIISFAAAIPDHLKQLFLIPVQLDSITSSVAAKIASHHYADGATPTGDTPEGDLFSYQTFKNDDNEPTVPSSEPGSIFEVDGADNLTHHQEYNFDENIQAPTDTSYLSDIDTTQYFDYPYRSKEKPRHSSISTPILLKLRLALKPEDLKSRIPDKIDRNSKKCDVSLVSYDKKSHVFSFSVDAGNGPKDVKASLSEIDEVALSCDCKFWRYNGPEFHASSNSFMLGQPYGTASPPNIRDPDRKYWLCKHAAAVLKRLDYFVQELAEENWDLDDDELMEQVDEQWDRLEGTVKVPEESLDDNDIDIEIDWDEEPKDFEPESAEVHPEEVDELAEENYDVDTSDVDEPVSEEHPVDYESLDDSEDNIDYEASDEVPEEHEQIDYEAFDEPEEEPEEEPEPEPEDEHDVDYEALREPGEQTEE